MFISTLPHTNCFVCYKTKNCVHLHFASHKLLHVLQNKELCSSPLCLTQTASCATKQRTVFISTLPHTNCFVCYKTKNCVHLHFASHKLLRVLQNKQLCSSPLCLTQTASCATKQRTVFISTLPHTNCFVCYKTKNTIFLIKLSLQNMKK